MIVGWLANVVAGGALKSVIGEIGQWQKRKLDAANDAERIEADKAIAQLEARAAVLKAEASSNVNQWFRAFIALGPACYIFKFFFVDKVVCSGFGIDDTFPQFCATDAIADPIMQGVMTAVLGFYFLSSWRK